MTPEEEIQAMYKHVQETPTASSMYPELAEELEWSIQHMARSGQMLADAQQEEQLARAKVMKEQIEKDAKIGASILKELTNALTANQSRMVTLIERLNSLLVHRTDILRTQISYIKSDLERSRYSQH